MSVREFPEMSNCEGETHPESGRHQHVGFGPKWQLKMSRGGGE